MEGEETGGLAERLGLGGEKKGEHWERWSYQPPISVQVLYINIPEQ